MDLRRLARQRLQRADVREAVSVPSVMQHVLHRWRAEISCALVMGDTNVFLDAVWDGLPDIKRREPAWVDMRLYDVQTHRVGI